VTSTLILQIDGRIRPRYIASGQGRITVNYALPEEVIRMEKTLACRDVGVDCPYVSHGETEEKLMAEVTKHAKEVHGYTQEQLEDPEMMKKVKAAIKTE